MLITLIATLIVAGLIWWLVEAFLPIDYRFKQLIYVLIVLYIIVVILKALGIEVPVLSRLVL